MTLIRARAMTELGSERITITDIVWTCDSCADKIKRSYPESEHIYIPQPQHFHIEDDPKRYIVRCQAGHSERYPSSEVYAAVNL
jgi:hypothetical protein